MPVPPPLKKIIEDYCIANLAVIEAGVRTTDFEAKIPVEPLWVREKPIEDDAFLAGETKTRPVCVMSWSVEDQQSAMQFMCRRVRYDYSKKSCFTVSDVVVANHTTISGATSATVTVTLETPRLYSITFFPQLISGSTSWISISIYDISGNLLGRQILYTEEINSDKEQEVLFDITVPGASQSSPIDISVVFDDYVIDSSSHGYKIGVNASNDVILTADTVISIEEKGTVREATFQVDFFARDKNRGQLPYPEFFVARKNVADAMAEAFRLAVLKDWMKLSPHISYTTVEQTPTYQNWLENLYIADAQVQVQLRYEELIGIEYPTLEEVTVKGTIRL